MDSETEFRLKKQIANLQAQINSLAVELRRLYRVTTHPSSRSFVENLSLTKGADHGKLTGLAHDDHTQYIKHSLATAANDFLVASGAGAFVKKTLAETQAIIGAGKVSELWASDGDPQAVWVDTAGKVGVGVAVPTAQLTVATNFELAGTSTTLTLQETDAAANNKYWDFAVAGETFSGRAVNDAYDTAGTWVQVDRTATTIDLITLGGKVASGQITLTEQTAPSAPADTKVTIYAVTAGGGKTKLMALFPSGVAQQIAIEP